MGSEQKKVEIDVEIDLELLHEVEFVASKFGLTPEQWISNVVEEYILKKFPQIV